MTNQEIGEMIGTLIVFLGTITIYWAVLVFIFGFSFTWVQVFGVITLFNLTKNILKK